MQTLVVILTVLSIFLVLYHHIGYPALLKALLSRVEIQRSALRFEDYEHTNKEYRELPFISILIPAFNEEKYIAEKIRNLACLDYPMNRLEIVLAADGCTDHTVGIARETLKEFMCEELPITIKEYADNRGKVTILNECIPQLKGEIVALTDVSSLVSINALILAAGRLKDNSVGAVSGNYRLLNPGSPGEATYWQYQRAIKQGEEILGSTLGAHGAFYAFKKGLFKTLPTGTINDDFVIPMKIVERGYRVVYEPQLNAIELERSNESQNWHRRIRIGFGNAQQIELLKCLFHPRFRGISLAFFSGKGLRVAMPFLMAIAFFGSWTLFRIPCFAASAILQTGIYGIAIGVQILCPETNIKVFRNVHYLVSGHLANLIGCLRFLRGKSLRRWS